MTDQPAQLVTTTVAGTELGCTSQSVLNWIKHGKVPVKATTIIKGQTVNLYDLNEIKAARITFTAVKPAPAPTPTLNLDALAERMSAEYQGLFKSVSADLGELVDNTAALREAITKLSDQNVLLFKTVEALRLAAQSTSVTPTSSNSPRLFTKTPDPAPTPPAPPKAKVCIIGLLANQQQMIAAEFSECFDLRMFHSDEARGPSLTAAAQNSDCVLLMANFVSHSIEATVKSAGGVKHEVVRGGMTTLRDRLVTLFANGVPTKKAATA